MELKKSIILFSLCLSVFFVGCDTNDDSATLEKASLVFDGDLNSDTAKLDALLEEIMSMVSSEVCSDSEDWLFTPIGYKSCGGPGPTGYLAYSKKINVDSFLEKVEIHRVSQKKLNEKWELVSTCELSPEPKWVRCENGEAVFVY
ncbi:MAG: hypothetical protein WBG90_13455 [Saonia sp.]